MPDWYALYTEPQKENYANEQLKARKFETLFPHTLDWVGLKTAFARLVRQSLLSALCVRAYRDDSAWPRWQRVPVCVE